ncbi:MAG: aldo/keto reductase, partial [Leptonema sp. (in: Bacteria)]|nr:aldo/keto reductase [Leptonema sp. (in: bacteria)]
MIPGKASLSGTKRYFERLGRSYRNYFELSWFQKPALLPFYVSKIGTGTYRLHRDRTEHHEALRQALISGINLIDTAPNYSDGAAEVLIGNVVAELIESKRIARDELVVVDHFGFIEGSTLQLLHNRYPTDTISISNRVKHCLHPDFLSLQLDWSTQKLGLHTIDIVLLQSPELLGFIDNQDQWISKMKLAFDFLEKQCQEGRIQFYGISSNLLTSPNIGIQMLELLISQSPPGFRVIQFSANLIETGYRNIGLPQYARKKGLFTLGCRPLNSIVNNSVYRLARSIDNPPEGEENPEARQIRLEDELYSLENRILSLINEKEHRFSYDIRTPSAYETLRHYRQKTISLENVLPLIDAISQPLQKTASQLNFQIERSSDPQSGQRLLERYLRLVHSALSFLPSYMGYRHHLNLAKFEKELQQETKTELPLSILAVAAVLADDIDSVFVGMRRNSAIRQITQIFSQKQFQKIKKINETWLPKVVD